MGPKPPTPKRTLKPTPKPSTKPPTTKHPTPSTGNAYPTHPPTPPTRGGNAYGRWGSPYTPAPWYGYNKWLYGNSWSQPQSPPKKTPSTKPPTTKPRRTGNAY